MPTLLSRVMFSALAVLPHVDVRAAYSMYFRWFLFFAVPFGLLTRLVYLRLCTQMSWTRRAIADVVMSACSSLTVVTVPLAWLVLALPRTFVNRIFGLDDSSPLNWVALLLTVAMFGAICDACIMRFVFRCRLGKQAFWLLYLVNAVTVAFAAVGMGAYMIAHPPIA
jgi:hypothetical protein